LATTAISAAGLELALSQKASAATLIPVSGSIALRAALC
jgi:hypothetical protein